MSSFLHWLAMGGYSIYVWSAYGLVCGVCLANVVAVKFQAAQTHKKLSRWFKRQSV
ncbi:heme exporter protein CcmD [Legionella fairfieldensis]|uniref:heme exporter protein CcmD n=1 Tax=Legionella fairfieldensis TaxID=45064 RepID=UPI00048D3783|nr:heme exporter protein CcmD [Legionella fairfieldensis]